MFPPEEEYTQGLDIGTDLVVAENAIIQAEEVNESQQQYKEKTKRREDLRKTLDKSKIKSSQPSEYNKPPRRVQHTTLQGLAAAP